MLFDYDDFEDLESQIDLSAEERALLEELTRKEAAIADLDEAGEASAFFVDDEFEAFLDIVLQQAFQLDADHASRISHSVMNPLASRDQEG